MKNKLFMLILFSSIGLYSQTEKPIKKGNYLIGGSANVNYQHLNENINYSVGFYPNVGYFVIDNFALGLSPTLGFGESKSKIRDNTSVYSNLGVGIMARYYFENCIFLNLSTGYSSYSSKSTGTNKWTTSNFNISPSVGYAYFINQNVSLDLNVGLNHGIYKSLNRSNNANGFFINVGFQIYLLKPTANK